MSTTMICTELPDTIDSLTFEASPVRTPGLHVSQIYHSICNAIDPKRFPEREEGDLLPWERFEAGFTFERVLELAFQARREGIFRPGELIEDGIILSPDGVDPNEFILEEFKCTWMSSFDAPEGRKFWHWLVQIQAYCYALGTLRARLRVLFVNGDYRHGYSPEFRCWYLTFTQDELDENWKMLVQHARMKGWL